MIFGGFRFGLRLPHRLVDMMMAVDNILEIGKLSFSGETNISFRCSNALFQFICPSPIHPYQPWNHALRNLQLPSYQLCESSSPEIEPISVPLFLRKTQVTRFTGPKVSQFMVCGWTSHLGGFCKRTVRNLTAFLDTLLVFLPLEQSLAFSSRLEPGSCSVDPLRSGNDFGWKRTLGKRPYSDTSRRSGRSAAECR